MDLSHPDCPAFNLPFLRRTNEPLAASRLATERSLVAAQQHVPFHLLASVLRAVSMVLKSEHTRNVLLHKPPEFGSSLIEWTEFNSQEAKNRPDQR